MDLKHQNESMKWINDNLYKLNTKNVILHGTDTKTINKNKIMAILTSNTGNYGDSISITNNNNNNN